MDLRGANLFVRYQRFHMISIPTIFRLLSRNVWLASIDLKDAYFHLSIVHYHRQYLRLQVGGHTYQFKVLPFDLASAPHVFTKCMAVVAAHLRLQGVMVFPFIDDWLLVENSCEGLKEHVRLTLQLLRSPGLEVNFKKSKLRPSQRVEFLSTLLDSRESSAYFAPHRVLSIREAALRFCHKRCHRARVVQKLLGHMASSTAVLPLARFHMKPLQVLFLENFNLHLHRPDRQMWAPRSILA
ncbi:uncharacterized protein LOC128347062 [Hemicordylus capensis]|uniref:uncharacterized protein LOC128347062 n=1 Tax=Hemicordylus capensis TaxID=884348 RepID=UPI0023031BF1|nr:uncharacterized protein LOC128347062 [Hemicordylus capensis]